MKADDKDGFAGLAPSPELQEWRVSCLAAEKARKQNGGENVFISGKGGEFCIFLSHVILPLVLHPENVRGRQWNCGEGRQETNCCRMRIRSYRVV